jgi:hypothetical protein
MRALEYWPRSNASRPNGPFGAMVVVASPVALWWEWSATTSAMRATFSPDGIIRRGGKNVRAD